MSDYTAIQELRPCNIKWKTFETLFERFWPETRRLFFHVHVQFLIRQFVL